MSWYRRNNPFNGGRSGPEKDEFEDLLVFGYGSQLFPNDASAENIAEERHLQSWNGDGSIRVDRYDCRLLLSTLDDATHGEKATAEMCPTEAMEEEMCDEERYRDMFRDIQDTAEREERERRESAEKRKAEIGFNYGNGNGQPSSSQVKEEAESSDSEDEPFVPPPGIKFPVGLELPENQKQNHIIERTATFVVAQGAQMEIVIKAKQRNNAEQFGFLEFDNVLYPYYKYVQKLIREKKYTPDLSKKPVSKKKDTKSTSAPKKPPVVSAALAAIADQAGSDSDSDSDCELHPALLAAMGKRSSSPDIRDAEGMAGPRSRPPPVKTSLQPPRLDKTDYTLSKGNDMYASLFKNLSQVTQMARQEAEPVKEEKASVEVETPPQATAVPEFDPEGRVDDPDYRAWYSSFYGKPCPWRGPRQLLPPPPDLETIVNSYADFVARRGADVEAKLCVRSDLQLHFMRPDSPHYSYYQHRVRTIQWTIAQEQYAMQLDKGLYIGPHRPGDSNGFDGPKGPFTPPPLLMHTNVVRPAAPPPPPPPPQAISSQSIDDSEKKAAEESQQTQLNRKQRRRLQGFGDVAAEAPPPGVVDPLKPNFGGIADLPKNHSAPALMQNAAAPLDSQQLVDPRNHPPVSFSLHVKSDEVKLAPAKISLDNDELTPSTSTANFELEYGVTSPQRDEQSDVAHIDDPLNSLNLKPPDPPSIPNNTQLDRKEKARLFMEKLLYEKRTKKLQEEEERKRLEMEAEEAKKGPPTTPKVGLSVIDEIINRRIDSLLVESGFRPEDSKEQPKKTEEKEKEKSEDSKKAKKTHRKRRESSGDERKKSHKKSRRASRSRSRDRRDRDRRRSRDRTSRRRSRSRDRR